MPDWIGSWIIIAIVILPLMRAERWIHQHIQGLGLLLTNDAQATVLFYYVSLLPGVILHEMSQWILAKVLRVKVKKFTLWPESQRGGVIRLGLVEIDQDDTDMLRSTLVGVIPLITGLAFITFIVNWRFDIDVLTSALVTGDLPTIGQGINAFMSAPDFWLWFYLVFTVANAMLPEEHDYINWWIILGIGGGLIAVMLILDLGILVQAWFEGPFSRLSRWASVALILSLCVDGFMIVLITIAEMVGSRVLGREVEY